MKYKKILLKLSGEALMGKEQYGIDTEVVSFIANELLAVHSEGIKTGVVIGGGNIFRGILGSAKGMDRVSADYMGMLATVINSLALRDGFEKVGIPTRVMTAIQMNQVAEPFIRLRALRHLEKGRVVIFAAGTGNPYFTTDTTAALRAQEIGADVVLKATMVNGIYNADPKVAKDAMKFDNISYIDVLTKRLKVMDSTAISMCMDNQLPIVVFDMFEKSSMLKIVKGESVGTQVS